MLNEGGRLEPGRSDCEFNNQTTIRELTPLGSESAATVSRFNGPIIVLVALTDATPT